MLKDQVMIQKSIRKKKRKKILLNWEKWRSKWLFFLGHVNTAHRLKVKRCGTPSLNTLKLLKGFRKLKGISLKGFELPCNEIPRIDSGKFTELSKLRSNRHMFVYPSDQIIQENTTISLINDFIEHLSSVLKHRGKIYLYQVSLDQDDSATYGPYGSYGVNGEIWRLDSCSYTLVGQLRDKLQLGCYTLF